MIFRLADPKPDKNQKKLQKVNAQNVNSMEYELNREKSLLGTEEFSTKMDRPVTASEITPRETSEYENIKIISPAYYDDSARGSFSKQKKKKKFSLPWWTVFVAYFLCLVSVGIAFWLCVEVAGGFGKEKAAEWLCSFAMSFVESVFLSQPIKVCNSTTFTI